MRVGAWWTTALALAIAALVATPAASAAKKAAPWDLRVAAVAEPPADLGPSRAFTLGWRVSRAGRATGAARLAFALSRDGRRGRDDLRLGRGVLLSKLARRTTAAGRATLVVPADVPAGAYRVLACIRQPGRHRRDRRPANDCRASRRAVQIRQRVSAGSPVSAGAGATPGSAVDVWHRPAARRR